VATGTTEQQQQRERTGRGDGNTAYQEVREEVREELHRELRRQEREDNDRMRGGWHRIGANYDAPEWAETRNPDVILLQAVVDDQRRRLPVTREQFRQILLDADTDPELRDLLRL
jgi:hypothetical protein